MKIADSIHSIPIRLTSERWVHIVENHDDLAGKYYDVLETIVDPDLVMEGKNEEFLAVRRQKPLSLVVVYREMTASDGFVVTAFQTSKLKQLIRTRKILWNKQRSKKH